MFTKRNSQLFWMNLLAQGTIQKPDKIDQESVKALYSSSYILYLQSSYTDLQDDNKYVSFLSESRYMHLFI